MKIVTRSEWGAKPPKSAGFPIQWEEQEGLAVHYTYGPAPANHRYCAREVRAVQSGDMNDPKENYRDGSYNWLVCAHGYAFEMRGWKDTTGANGTWEANRRNQSVCFLGRVVKPTDARVEAFVALREQFLNRAPKAKDVRPHSAFKATACPGAALHEWIRDKGYEDMPQFTEEEANWLRRVIALAREEGIEWPKGFVSKLIAADKHTKDEMLHAPAGPHTHEAEASVIIK